MKSQLNMFHLQVQQISHRMMKELVLHLSNLEHKDTKELKDSKERKVFKVY